MFFCTQHFPSYIHFIGTGREHSEPACDLRKLGSVDSPSLPLRDGVVESDGHEPKLEHPLQTEFTSQNETVLRALATYRFRPVLLILLRNRFLESLYSFLDVWFLQIFEDEPLAGPLNAETDLYLGNERAITYRLSDGDVFLFVVLRMKKSGGSGFRGIEMFVVHLVLLHSFGIPDNIALDSFNA